MSSKLPEKSLRSIRVTLHERFGEPLKTIGASRLAEGVTCQGCGSMLALEGETCNQCGMMKPLDEVTPPGREQQVKALKKQKNVDNPWAVAWSSYDKSHKKNEAFEAGGRANDNDVPKPISYEVVDGQTGKVVAKSSSRKRAQTNADKRDLEYGGYRFQVRPVYE